MSTRTHLAGALILLSALSPLTASAQSRPSGAPERQGLQLDGRAIQGGLVVGRASPGSRVTLQGRPVRVADDGVFLIGFGMDAPETMSLEVVGPGGDRMDHTFRIEQRSYATERIDSLPEEEVDLDRATQAKLQRARRRIDALRRRFTPIRSFAYGLDWPVRGRVSTSFGVRRILSGEPREPHDAIDIAVPRGTPVRAPAGGVVIFTSEDLPLAGKTVIVDHGQGLTSTFLHMSEIRVRPGDLVEPSAVLGLSGDTGRTTGAHLHWAVHLAGVALDPELLAPTAR